MAYAIVCGVVAIMLVIIWRKVNGRKVTFKWSYSHDNGRPLGLMENAIRTFHDTKGNIILANTLVLRSKKLITRSVIGKAMQLLMKRHPLLRMTTKQNEDGDYCLQKMDPVEVDLRELDTKDWKNVMEETLLEKFDGENGPLWRVIFLPNARYEPETGSDVTYMMSCPHECLCIFGFHHVIADGPSYSRMFAEFMKYVSKLNNNEDLEVKSMPMLPPMDLYMDEVVQSKWYHHLIGLVLQILCFIPGFVLYMKRKMIGSDNAYIRKHGVEIQRNPQIQPRTKIVPLEFTKDETSSLLKKCKEHDTTIQGVVQTAAGIAMVKLLEEQEYEVKASITVNMRPFLKSSVPNNQLGMYFCGLQSTNLLVVSPDIAQFWGMARKVSEDIHTRLHKNEHINMWPMIKCMLPLMEQAFKDTDMKKDVNSGNRYQQLLVFTNLGYAKFLDRSAHDDVILRARFGCSAEHESGNIFGNNMVTFNGQLFWTIIYYSNIVSDATAHKYADLVKENIQNVTSDIPS